MAYVVVRNVGRMSYNDALYLQKAAARSILDKLVKGKGSTIINYMFIVEHDPVYTIGIRQKLYTVAEEKKLRSLGADFVKTDRGGLITFHGPGQLVCYPVLYLGNFSELKSMKWYVQQLEETAICVCRDYGLSASRSAHTGVWIEDRKIAAIGVHGSRYVTTHGIAINCNVDLGWFEHISPCGIPDKSVTSLSKELNLNISVHETIPFFLKAFRKQFHCEYGKSLTITANFI